MTCGRNRARCAETAAARPHGPPPTITRSASFAIASIQGSGYADRTGGKCALDADDLIAPGPDADVSDLRLYQRLYAVEVATGLDRQICKASSSRCSCLPPIEPLVP